MSHAICKGPALRPGRGALEDMSAALELEATEPFLFLEGSPAAACRFAAAVAGWLLADPGPRGGGRRGGGRSAADLPEGDTRASRFPRFNIGEATGDRDADMGNVNR